MSDQAKDYDLNDGVQIILNRMKTNPEEFFDDGGRWRWIFKDTLREVMTEIEKAAIFEALKEVRRVEITSRAASTVLRAGEEEKERAEKDQYAAYGKAIPKAEGGVIGRNPSKVITSRGY
jgi:hypothetical protein